MLSDIINRVCDDVGLNRPLAPITAQTDRQTLQLLALLRAAGDDLITDFDWQALIQVATITTVAGTQNYALPTDWARSVTETEWFTTAKVPLFGPLNDKDFAQNAYGLINVGPYYRYQIKQGGIYLQPVPTTSGQTLNYVYVSSYWVRNFASATSTYTNGASFVSDSDLFNLNEQLLFLGARWRWRRAKGLAYDEEKDEYDRESYRARADDRGSRSLDADPAGEVFNMQTGFIVPVTGFGS